jgi:hypothetical protein
MAIYVRTAKKSQNTRSSSARSPQPTDAIAPGTAGNNTHLKSGGIAKSQTYRYKLADLIASEVDHTVVMVEFAIKFGENTSLLEKYDMAVDPSRYIYVYQYTCIKPSAPQQGIRSRFRYFAYVRWPLLSELPALSSQATCSLGTR